MEHATVEDVAAFGLRNNEGLWPSYNCLDTLVPTPFCPDPAAQKTFSFADWVPAFEFAVHGGVQCKAVGLDVADMKSEIKRVFEANEGKGVEQALLLNRFVADAGNTPALWDAPVDLTPVSGISLVVALAMLEGYAAANYAGVPTIHMPRAAATVLSAQGLISWQGSKAFTKNGSKVAIGGGYDVSETDGTWDLFATGEVYIERSDQVDVFDYVIPGDGSGTGEGQNGLTDNTVIALVERMYRVAVDCFVVKATGKVY
jgi:hypothetical protein